jgi:hypothetical protein
MPKAELTLCSAAGQLLQNTSLLLTGQLLGLKKLSKQAKNILYLGQLLVQVSHVLLHTHVCF